VAQFVPRPRLHDQIRRQLHDVQHEATDTRILVVSGLGGSGKSQLVLNYVREYRMDHKAIFWVEAGQKESIERDFLQIYRQLFDRPLTVAQELLKMEDVVPAVKSWFHAQTSRSLIVFDSADGIDENDSAESYIDITIYQPDAPLVDVVITTRCAQAARMTDLEVVEVGEMGSEEAVALFRKHAQLRCEGPGVDDEVSRIVNELGFLALAIALAGSYVGAMPQLRSNLHLYLPEYRAQRRRLLDNKPKKHIHRYGESVLSTWETSFVAVMRQSVIAANLLSLLAFLNFDDIYPTLFEFGDGGECQDVQNRPKWQLFLSPQKPINDRGIEAAMSVLEMYWLVQWRDVQSSYVMHKLVHAWALERLEETQQRQLSVAVLNQLGNVTSRALTPMAKARLLPHVTANFVTIMVAYAQQPCEIETLDAIAKIGEFVQGTGRWTELYEIRTFLFRMTGTLLGREHHGTLASMNNLALVLSDQGKYERAEETQRQVLGLCETVLGKEHPHTLTSMDNLAVVLGSQGKYEEAEEIYRQALRLEETVLGKEHPSTLTSMNNLALVLSSQGKYEQAEEMYRLVLGLQKTILGKEHPSTLTSMNNLPLVLRNQGKYEQAEEMYRQVLGLRKTVLGKEHPSTLTSMNNLASVLSDQGKYEQAEETQRQALRLRETMLGKEHPSTLTSMNNLASVLSGQGKYEQAEEIYRQTLGLREAVLGKEHPNTLTSMNNLASVLSSQRKHEQAEETQRQVLGLCETVLGKEHPHTLTSMNNLAVVLSNQGKYEEAEETQRQALGLRETVLGKEHPDTLTSMKNLALVLIYQGKYEQAEEMLR
jgi:tetratricopeptide (TPR) repeat protein